MKARREGDGWVGWDERAHGLEGRKGRGRNVVGWDGMTVMIENRLRLDEETLD